VAYVPGAHAAHSEDPAAATEPTAQGAHVLRPGVAAKVPAAHVTQDAAWVLPASALAEPAGHSVQATDAGESVKVPGAQVVQSAAWVLLKLPAAHAVQADALGAEW
jgi:hypothetical protein